MFTELAEENTPIQNIQKKKAKGVDLSMAYGTISTKEPLLALRNFQHPVNTVKLNGIVGMSLN